MFNGLGKLEGEHTIQLKDDNKPFCLTTPRRVALPLLKKVEKEINRLRALDVIEPVDEPTDWCAPIVVVPKASGDVRMCVDLTRLNQAVKRELYPMPTVEGTLGKISEGNIYSKLDANSGFHQVPLDQKSCKLTTFVTPFGRYMFKRLPYGITSAPEHYQKRMENVLKGLSGVVCHVDDILVTGKTEAQHNERLRAVLDRLQEAGLTLNPEKCVFSVSRLDYLGQIVDGQGIRKDPNKLKAILNLCEPQDITELRRFLGMANQLMKFCCNMAERTKPLRDLLKKDVGWCWGPAQEAAFRDVKEELVSDRVLAIYNPERETVISADASSYGLGAVLLQRQPTGELRPVAFASRSMTETECRYAQIEKEALATTWAFEHWQDLLVGMPDITVETDHKPLVPLFSTKLIDELPVRIQRFRMRLMRFKFKIQHVPGKLLYTADTLSRSPLKGHKDDDELRNEVQCYINAVMVNLPASDARLEEIRRELKKDEILSTVMYYVQHGWPEHKRSLSGPIIKFWPERGSLTVQNDLLLKGSRLVVPVTLRKDILRYLHDAHQGVTRTSQNAQSSVWWPGLSREIRDMIQSCGLCQKYKRERVEPMKGTPFPERPWSRVGADFFFHKGHTYLLVVDYYSCDVEICLVSKKVNAFETANRMKKVFSRHGICDILFTDNGPQFSSEYFKEFARVWHFNHVTSSPGYAQSNGEVERCVQTIKNILKKCEDEYLALLTYRNTPLHNGYSPAQLSMGRALKTRVPCSPESLLPKLPDCDKLRKREKEYRDKMALNYNKKHRVVEGETLSFGDKVWIPDQQTEGTVVKPHESPRSVIINTPKGTIRRNRRMTRKLPAAREEVQPNTCVTPRSCDQDTRTSQYSRPHTRSQGLPSDSESTSNGEELGDMQSQIIQEETPSEIVNEPRRSGRISKPPTRYIDEC